jgi:hypothetical protein
MKKRSTAAAAEVRDTRREYAGAGGGVNLKQSSPPESVNLILIIFIFIFIFVNRWNRKRAAGTLPYRKRPACLPGATGAASSSSPSSPLRLPPL